MHEREKLYKALRMADRKGWDKAVLIDGKAVKVLPVGKSVKILGGQIDRCVVRRLEEPSENGNALGYKGVVIKQLVENQTA